MHHGHHGQERSTYRMLAQALGYFSIALGAVELLAPRRLGEPLGLKGQEKLIQAYGLREIATGVAILSSKNPTPWIWGRVAGDALDIATLSAGLSYQDDRRRNAGLAIASVMGVTALDVVCAMGLQKEAREQEEAEMAPMLADMRSRSGFPKGVEGSLVSYDEAVPADFRVPASLRPWDATRTGAPPHDVTADNPLSLPGSSDQPLNTGIAGTSETDVVVEAADRIGGQDDAGSGLAARA